MKKYIVFLFALILLAGSIGAADKKSNQPLLPLDCDEFLWHFGMIPRDAQVSHHYALTNNNEDTVTITEVVSDCDCTRLPKFPIAIPPGETHLFKVQYDTKTYFGETNRDIHLVTDFKPAPEMTIYFTSLASRLPNTIAVTPRSTAFIPGKNSQQFIIENLADDKAEFTLIMDNDSVFTVSETNFKLKGKQKHEIIVSPLWDKIPNGSHYSCIVVEVSRKERFRVTIPIKINKF